MANVVKNDSSQAMQNLFSAYGGDDADESMATDMQISDDEDFNNHTKTPDVSKPDEQLQEKPSSKELEQPNEPEAEKPKLERKATRLVSYGPDDQEDGEIDEDDEEENSHLGENNIFTGFKSLPTPSESKGTRQTAEDDSESVTDSSRSITEDDLQIPPEPEGKCSIRVQAKIEKLYQKMLRSGKDMNAAIQGKKEVRNPSIYEKLIEYCHIDEKGTNYPPELYNPTIWGDDSTYEVLAQIQHAEMERRTKKDKATVERIHGTKKPQSQPSPSSDLKRKSKWDSTGTNAASSTVNIK